MALALATNETVNENKCNKCNKVFAYNYLLMRHQTRKTSCIPKSSQTELNIVGLDDKIKEIDQEL